MQKAVAVVSKSGNVTPFSVMDRYAVKSESKQLPADSFENKYGEMGLIQPLYNLEALARLMEANPYHYRCVKTKARDAAGLGWEIKPVEGRDNDTASQEQYKALDDFFSSQWPPVTTVLDKVQVDYEAIGNGYMEFTRIDDDPNKLPAKFNHVPGHTIRIHQNGKKYCQIRGNRKAWFKVAGGDYDIDRFSGEEKPLRALPPEKRASELIHIYNYTARSDYYGMPDILPSLGALQGHLAQRDYNIKFFENHGVPAYVVYVTGDYDLGDPDENGEFEIIKTIKGYFDQLQKEPHSVLVFGIPGSGGGEVKVEMKPLSVEAKDASFRLYRKDNRDEVFSVHGVPAYRVGVIETGSLGGSIAKEATEIYKNSVINPRQESLEDHINQFIVWGAFQAHDWCFNLCEIDTSNEDHDMTVASNLFDKGGASPNDLIRYFGRRFGIEPVDHPAMDAYYIDGRPVTNIENADPEIVGAVKALHERLVDVVTKHDNGSRSTKRDFGFPVLVERGKCLKE